MKSYYSSITRCIGSLLGCVSCIFAVRYCLFGPVLCVGSVFFSPCEHPLFTHDSPVQPMLALTLYAHAAPESPRVPRRARLRMRQVCVLISASRLLQLKLRLPASSPGTSPQLLSVEPCRAVPFRFVPPWEWMARARANIRLVVSRADAIGAQLGRAASTPM